MALFQEAIVKKHLKDLDPLALDIAYNEYLKVYSTEKIKNIRIAKEEQYQEGFIKDIFGSVLGYSVYPESPYNIETEKKNEGNARKADGAILKDEKVVGVIELKDNKTKNLDTVKDQAFGYKNNHKECSYVISSNFHKLRFYIDDATEYEEFDLYNLDKESFKRFYLYLRKEGLLDKNIPKLLRQETKFHEEEISKKLYKDYSNFKGSFFENALTNNPQFDRLALFKKSQKFLDRVLFVLFAEDKGLISTNSVVQIVEKWQALRDDAFDTPRPLYALVLLFFNNLYLGKKDNNGNVLIPEFGGELFAPDEVLDQLTIDDDVLKDDLLKLSQYDFNTDVDVNILGHIFEHSLNEVDDVEAELRGEQLDKTKSKRKKDGVFYTPKYITKYIVDNTLGKLCSEKKSELKLDIDIFIDDFQKTDGKLNEKGKDLFERLNTYKSWLLTVKVCDPACGSGAFLNQALSFFIEEHKFVDDLIAELTNSPLRLFDTDLQILENNIYGVDINEESVEIAKLSLWLRTAQPGRKLSNLSNNIKCGNSLIDDPKVAGDKAFNWGREFPSVFIEKNKFAFHITTSLHDSRTSPRMLEFKVRERRFDGSKPNAEVNPLTKEEEELIATTVSEIAKEDDLNIAAFNLCRDHMHILLVCEEGEISSIMQKIKAKTARAVNILRGITKVVEHGQTSHNKGAGSLDEIERETSRNKGACSLDDTENTGSLDDSSAVHRIDTPRGEKQNSLWTQKFGCKPVRSDEQFWNTVHYIENNKEKHKLPRNPKLETIISRFVKTYEDCLKTEYTGGFDVVIGNPPYVSHERIDNKDFLKNNFESYSSFGDLYIYFYELSLRITNTNGLTSMITSNSFLKADYGKPLRKLIQSDSEILEIINIENTQIFSDATVNTVILTFSQNKNKNALAAIVNSEFKEFDFNSFIAKNKFHYSQEDLDIESWNLIRPNILKLKRKIKSGNKSLEEFNTKIRLGIATGDNNVFIIDELKKNELIEKDNRNSELLKPILRGRDIDRYFYTSPNLYLILTKNGINVEKDFPVIFDYFNSFGDNFKKRGAKGQHWTNLRACSFFDDFKEEKIIWIELSDTGRFSLCNDEYYLLNSAYFLIPPKNLKAGYLLSLLNSKLMKFYLQQIAATSGVGTLRWINNYVKEFPIPALSFNEQIHFQHQSEKIITLINHFNDINYKLQRTLKRKFEDIEINKKLENWYELTYTELILELSKKKIKLSIADEAEWEDYFVQEQQKALALKSQIDQTDAAIDRMVYELYGLTEEEIQIVENS
jgi:REP element-mobilizing transposase RayT